jgi:hypothetical protein
MPKKRQTELWPEAGGPTETQTPEEAPPIPPDPEAAEPKRIERGLGQWHLDFGAPIHLLNPRGGSREPKTSLDVASADLLWSQAWIEFPYLGEAVRVPFPNLKAALYSGM